MDATKGRLNLYTSDSRMVPSDLNPICHKILMSVPNLPKSSDKSSCIPSAFKKKGFFNLLKAICDIEIDELQKRKSPKKTST